MMNVRQRLDRGEFNNMSQATLPDGSVLITLSKRGDPHVYRMVVKDLYGKHEKVVSEEVTGWTPME